MTIAKSMTARLYGLYLALQHISPSSRKSRKSSISAHRPTRPAVPRRALPKAEQLPSPTACPTACANLIAQTLRLLPIQRTTGQLAV